MLGGGGGRGLAHAGAMIGLDRRGFDPELVVGTSIGAVVGALYAAGYEPDSIAAFVGLEDWVALFAPSPWTVGPDRARWTPIIRLSVGSDRPRRVDGLFDDTGVNRRLVRLLFDAGARARGDFDALPRRFRAVATDFVTGDEVVPDRGDLALAVRASMAVPGLFQPVSMDSMVLVDGGIGSYLPVGVASALGARRIVAVDVLRPEDEIEGADPLAAITRGFRLILRNTLPDSIQPWILLRPEVPRRLYAAYFPRDPRGLIESGRRAALESVPAAAGGAPIRRQRRPPPASFSGLVVESDDPTLRLLAEREFAAAAPGPYSPVAVFRAMDRLYATGFFAGVWPHAAPPPSDAAAGDTQVVLQVRAEPATRTRWAASLGYDNDVGAHVRLSLRHSIPALLAHTGASVARTGLGWVAAAEAAALTATHGLAWTAGLFSRETDIRVYDADRIVGETEVRRHGGWVGLDWAPGSGAPDASLTAGAEYVQTGAGDDGFSAGPRLVVGEAQRASRVIGLPWQAEAELRVGEIAYWRVRAGGSVTHWLDRWGVALLGDIEAADRDAPADVLPSLGGEPGVPGLRQGFDRAAVRALSGVDVAHPIVADGYARLRLRAGATALRLDALDRAAWTAGAELGAIWATPWGTVELGLGSDEDGRWRAAFAIGQRFRW